MSFIPFVNAAPFAILAGSAVTNTGVTTITGDLGISPGASITGFPPGIVIGTIHSADSVSSAAQTSLTTSYNNAAGQLPITANLTGQDLGGMTLSPGIYKFDTSAQLTGILTLNALGNPTAVWIFQIGSTLTTSSGSSVVFSGGLGCPGRVYWQVGSSATLGITTAFIGNIMALSSISLNNGATINGRALARNGAVTMDANNVFANLAIACTGGDPHIICLDGSRLDVYQEGFYRLFDNCDDKEHIIINADIRRRPDNHLDYYNQIWIKIRDEKSLNHEYLLDFGKDGISVNQSQPSPRWEQNYITRDNLYYTFKCESKYNTVGLTIVDSIRSILCSGLMAGQILPLKNLKDESHTVPVSIKIGQYNQNSLVAGSVGPHIITAQKKSILVKNNWYRLLQWKTIEGSGIINAKFDDVGQIRQMIICSNQNNKPLTESWKWIGEEHWNIRPFKNDLPLDRQSVHKHKFFIGNDSEILLRIQGNGSVSASFKNVKSNVRGLLFGDIQIVNGPYYLQIYKFSDQISKNYVSSPTGSLYQRLIEPMAA